MNEKPKKVSTLAIVFFVLAGLYLIGFVNFAYNSWNSNVPSYLRYDSITEYLSDTFKYNTGEMFLYLVLPVVAFIALGVFFYKKGPIEKKPKIVVEQQMPASNADELKKYKELLDSGVIKQEEFDAKKKELLGLER